MPLIKSGSQQKPTSTPELELGVGLDVLKSLDYRKLMVKEDVFGFTSSCVLCMWLERYLCGFLHSPRGLQIFSAA